MKFYYNMDINCCAEETWVSDYLYNGGMVDSREEAIEALRTKREFYGWFECDVSGMVPPWRTAGTWARSAGARPPGYPARRA